MTRVLYLNAYSLPMKWANDILIGVEEGLGDVQNLDLMVEFMDTKRFPGPEHIQGLRREYSQKYQGIDLDLLIVSDDNALSFIETYRDELFPGVPVVFCGANYLTSADLAGHDDYLGVSETVDLRDNIDLMLRLHPDTERIYLSQDKTVTGQKMRAEFLTFLDEYADQVEFVFLEDETLAELLDIAASMPEKSLMLHVGKHRDRFGVHYDSDEVLRQVALVASRPVYCLWDVVLGLGAVGGKLTNGFFQGLEAGHLASELLRGRDIHELPRVVKSPNRYMFDYKAMAKAGVKLSDLPKNSIVINKPLSFYHLYKREVWLGAAFLVLLLALITVMSLNMLQRKHAQAQLSQAHDELRTIFDSSQVGILLLREERRVHMVNDRLLEIFGYDDSSELVGKSVKSLHLSDGAFAEFGEKHHAAIMEGNSVYVEFPLRHRQGSTVWVALSGAAVDESVPPDPDKGVLWMLTDITERKRAEDELAALNSRLEELVRERTQEVEDKARELEEANRQLRELDRLKSSFLNTVSHDLRTPLTSIRGFAKLINRDFQTTFLPEEDAPAELRRKAERIRQNLEIIEKEGNRLTRLVNDFLDLSKIENGAVEWRDKEVSLTRLIQDAICAVEGDFAEKPGVDLKVELDESLPAITADADRIIQVLVNLLNNAIKYTDQGEVRVLVGINDKGWPLARVSDTGPGIPHHELDLIFDKFRQVGAGDTLSHDRKGSGLGLAICREIVAHYQGCIWVESEPGMGSTFCFTLPPCEERAG